MGLCSALTLLTLLLWLGTAMYVAGGIYGLSSTLTLFEKYGPVNNSGNPALDPPPQLRWDPAQGQYVPVNPSNPGNRVPKAFKICMGILGTWAIIILISSFAFIIDSHRCQTAIRDASYVGERTSDSAISCTSFMTGYCVFLVVAWFVQAGFAVLPVLEYRITMQRCWDLNNPQFAETTKRTVCLDLVQYGLVLFRETSNANFGLICGPGGNYNPPRGDLAGFCEKYSPSFAAFVICFAGAGLSTIALVLFTIHHSSNFIYLKVRRYEGQYARQFVDDGYRPPPYKTEQFGRPMSNGYSDVYPPIETSATVKLVSPKYAETRQPRGAPVPEVMNFKRYPEEEDEIEMHAIPSPKYKEIEFENESVDDSEQHAHPPAYKHSNGGPSYAGDSDEPAGLKHGRSRSKRRHRRRDRGSEYSYRGSRMSESSRGRRIERPSEEEELSARYSSDEDRSHTSRRQRDTQRDESPGSDYYMKQDRQRRSSNRYR